MRIALFLLSLSFVITAWSYEVDQFTRRDEKPKDSTDILDQEIQKRLASAIKEANSGIFKFKCNGDEEDKKESRMKLFNAIKDQLTTNSPIGVMEKFASQNKSVAKRKIAFSDSIYKGAANYSKILNTYGTTAVINVNNTQIGADKLGHFFDQGYAIYLMNYKATTERRKYYNGLQHSISTERDEYGALTTGVYSYADIAANYGGHKFWEKVCGNSNNDTKEEDKQFLKIHRCNKDAYVQCDINTGNWILNPSQKFTFKDYVTPAWDESINCSLYASDASSLITSEMSRKVHFYKGNPKQPCPAEPQKCIELQKQYDYQDVKSLTSPICKQIIAASENKTPINKNEKFNYDLEYHLSRKTSDYGTSSRGQNDKARKGAGKN